MRVVTGPIRYLLISALFDGMFSLEALALALGEEFEAAPNSFILLNTSIREIIRKALYCDVLDLKMLLTGKSYHDPEDDYPF